MATPCCTCNAHAGSGSSAHGMSNIRSLLRRPQSARVVTLAVAVQPADETTARLCDVIDVSRGTRTAAVPGARRPLRGGHGEPEPVVEASALVPQDARGWLVCSHDHPTARSGHER